MLWAPDSALRVGGAGVDEAAEGGFNVDNGGIAGDVGSGREARGTRVDDDVVGWDGELELIGADGIRGEGGGCITKVISRSG